MKTAKQAARQAKQFLRVCRVDGVMQEDRVRRVVDRVIERKPRGYLVLLSHLKRLVKLDCDRHTAHVETAVPLPPDLQISVENALQRVYGPEIGILFTRRPELIGGMRIKVGSDVYDGSVRYALDVLEKQF
jgi:F-type H+-transporting ATPase subunit delta